MEQPETNENTGVESVEPRAAAAAIASAVSGNAAIGSAGSRAATPAVVPAKLGPGALPAQAGPLPCSTCGGQAWKARH
jgi:hypothetical protein